MDVWKLKMKIVIDVMISMILMFVQNAMMGLRKMTKVNVFQNLYKNNKNLLKYIW